MTLLRVIGMVVRALLARWWITAPIAAAVVVAALFARVTPPLPDDQPVGTERDLHGDALPPGAVARLGTTRFRRGAAWSGVAFTPDGRTIIATCYDRRIGYFDADTGVRRRTLAGHRGVVPRRAGVPDPEDVFDRKRLLRGDSVHAVALTSDGRTLVSAGEVVRIWDAATGEQRRLVEAAGQIGAAAVSPDGTLLAFLDWGDSVRLLDLVTGDQREVARAPANGNLRTIAFDPRGGRIAWGDDKGAVHVLDVSGDVAGDVPGDGPPTALRPLDSSVVGLQFAPDGRSLWALDGLAAVLRCDLALDPGNAPWHFTTGRDEARRPFAFAVSPDGSTVATSTGSREGPFETTIDLWAAKSGDRRSVLSIRRDAFWGLTFSPDGATLAGTNAEGVIRRLDVAGGRELPGPEGSLRGLTELAISPDGRTAATCGRGGLVRLWDVADGRPLRRIETGAVFAGDLAFVAGGSRLRVLLSDGVAAEFDVTTGLVATTRRYPDVQGTFYCRLGGSRVVCVQPGVAYVVWDVESETETARIPTRATHPFPFAVSPDGEFLAYGGVRVRVASLTTGEEIAALDRDMDPSCFALSADNGLLAVGGSSGGVVVWDLREGVRRVRHSPESDWRCDALAFSADGALLAAGVIRLGHMDVEVWSVATGKRLAAFAGHAALINDLAFTPDRRRLVSVSRDTTGLVWDVSGLD